MTDSRLLARAGLNTQSHILIPLSFALQITTIKLKLDPAGTKLWSACKNEPADYLDYVEAFQPAFGDPHDYDPGEHIGKVIDIDQVWSRRTWQMDSMFRVNYHRSVITCDLLGAQGGKRLATTMLIDVSID